MSALKTHDPARQQRSRYYRVGYNDGLNDCSIVSDCPPGDPLGPDPERAWSYMYQAGYDAAWAGACRHKCSSECKKERTEEEQ